MKFKLNVGGLDSWIRIAVGVVLVYVGFINPELINDKIASMLLGIVGVVALVTGTVRFCPLYTTIDFSTRSPEPKE